MDPHHTQDLNKFSRASAECMPTAYVCHGGPNHDTGHIYFVILVYRDLMWLADDGRAPTVLPFLTPQLAGQIVQVWAVQTSVFVTPRQIARALPPPEPPDFDPPLHETPPKKARFTQQLLRLNYANITSFGKQVLDWLWSRDNELCLFVETRSDKQKRYTMCQYFAVRVRCAFGAPAFSNTDNTGTHGASSLSMIAPTALLTSSISTLKAVDTMLS